MIRENGTGYHAVIWNEPLLQELGSMGRRGMLVPRTSEKIKKTVGDVTAAIPSDLIRSSTPKLPELAEPEVVRHFVRLSQQTFGTDSGINAGVGTCTMKYNPKINEVVARAPQVARLHPLQDEETVQGLLEIMYRLNKWLCEIAGMDRFSLQPRGGAHAVFANARIMRAYHDSNGDAGRRNKDLYLCTHLLDL